MGIYTIPQLDGAGLQKTVTDKPTGDFTTRISHNWCDNTTWAGGTSDSSWLLQPSAGEIYRVVKAEVQYQHDLAIAPKALDLNYYVWHPASPGTPIVGLTIPFVSTYSLYEYGNEHFHAPATAEIGALSTIIFNYANKLSFYGDENYGELAYLEVKVRDDSQLTGTYATIGFVTNTESV